MCWECAVQKKGCVCVWWAQHSILIGQPLLLLAGRSLSRHPEQPLYTHLLGRLVLPHVAGHRLERHGRLWMVWVVVWVVLCFLLVHDERIHRCWASHELPQGGRAPGPPPRPKPAWPPPRARHGRAHAVCPVGEGWGQHPHPHRSLEEGARRVPLSSCRPRRRLAERLGQGALLCVCVGCWNTTSMHHPHTTSTAPRVRCTRAARRRCRPQGGLPAVAACRPPQMHRNPFTTPPQLKPPTDGH